MKFLIYTVPFDNFNYNLFNNGRCLKVYKNDFEMYDVNNHTISPICINDYYFPNINSIFKNNWKIIDILINKSKFGEYMINNFSNHIACVLFYNYSDITFINNDCKPFKKMISKINDGFCGKGINIQYNMDYNLKNAIVTEYIEHTEYFVGHFLVLNGKIIDKIYFCSKFENPNGIKTELIRDYQIKLKLDIDDTIFDKIFSDLNYSGFADSDFIENNNKIIIFEITPALNGGLIIEKEYFNKFLDTLENNIKFNK